MNRYLIIVVIFLSQMTLLAQNTCNIYFETSSSSGTGVEIDVKANGFTNVLGFQMYVKWDSTVLKKVSVMNANTNLSGLSFGANQLGSNIQSANWYYTGLEEGVTLSPGAVLFTIKYDYFGDPCDETSIILADLDNFRKSLITYSFAEETEFPLLYTPSNVQIPGENCGGSGENVGVGFHIDCLTAPAGSQVCVPIRVDSFSQIATLQFSITWNTSVLSYVSVQNNYAEQQGADDIGTNVINNNTLIYSMATTNPLTLPDGGILIEVCFLVVGSNGQIGNIDFSNQVAFEVTNDDGPLPYYTENCSVTVGVVENPVTFTVVGVNNAPKDETICIDITGKNFKNIESFLFIVKWNSSVLTWKELGPVNNIGISGGSGGHISPYGTDGLKIAWNDAQGKTVADGSTLFQLCFDAIGACGSSTVITIIGESGFEIEVSSNEVLLPHLEVPGTVKIECAIPDITSEIFNVTCNTGADGRILLTMPSGNINNYNFKWYKGTTLVAQGNGKNTLLGIGAGIYSVVVTEIADPTKTVTIDNLVITEPAAMVINQTIVNVTCASKGSISLSVTGNNPPYTYQWNPVSIGNTPNAANLNAGSYAVTVVDSKSCPSVNKTFSVTSNITALSLTSQFTDITCKDANDGKISLSVSGGCTPYSIVWSDGLAANQLNRINLAAGTYKVTVTDSQSQSTENTFNITNPVSAINISGEVQEGSLSSIDLTVTGGSAPYIIAWTGPNGFTSSKEDLTDLLKGIYTVSVTDMRGCEFTESFEVKNLLESVIIKLSANNNKYNGYGIKCKGECNGSITAAITANVPYKVFLDNVEITLPYDQVCGGTRTLRVVDAIGLSKDTTFTVTEPLALAVTVDEVICENAGKEDGTIQVITTGGVPEYTYDWGIAGVNSALAENLIKGTYSVKVTDKNGCSVISEQVKIDNCDKSDCFTGSLILTPNEDGYNDFFLMKCSEDLTGNYLYVYNRIGNEVYRQSNYDGTWNGLDNDGNTLPEDGYLWVFTGKNEAGIKEVYKGSVTILR